MNTIEYAATVADKKRRVFATFPAAHKRAPISGEVFSSKDAIILRLKVLAAAPTGTLFRSK